MKAAVLEKPGMLTVKDIPLRTCSNDEVLIKVKSCGICGSDLRYFKGENPWALHTLGKSIPNPPNLILGHEFAGIVADAGSPALRHLIGKRVCVEPYNTCGMCDNCRTGKYNLCVNTRHIGHSAGWPAMDYTPGGMAEYCQVWATHVYELPDSISFEEATILDPLAVAIHAVSISGFKPGDTVLVMGSGPVGICIAQTVKVIGSVRVFCTDIYDNALKVAEKVGADDALNVNLIDIEEYVFRQTGNRGVNLVFDTVGTRESQKQALTLLSTSGTLVNLVANSSQINYTLKDLSGERSIKGSSNNLYDDFLLGIRLMAAGRIQVKPMINHHFLLEDVNRGFDVLFDKTGSGAVKVVIDVS
ncbi:MAG: hypothetical protein A2Y21_03740 [Clostridiales bacterium GWC2_40_7]|nr:MAG: hypothetical protein A2Y21_03740 [Clostridiales bacterium GWC2_40_7]